MRQSVRSPLAPGLRAAVSVRWLVLTVAIAGCADPRVAASRAAITAGTEDAGDTAVAALLRDGEPVCTATLVADDLLLTAAHCVEPAPSHAFFGAALLDGELVRVIDREVHPDFDPVTLEHDLAIAVLEEAPAAAPVALPSGPLDPLPGRRLRLVGFGATSADQTGPATKRTGDTVIASASAADFRYGPSPSQTCAGDSGGPGFLAENGVEVLAGVTSAGDPACAAFARDARVDVEVDGFLAPYAGSDVGCGGGAPTSLLLLALRRPCRGRRPGARRGRASSS